MQNNKYVKADNLYYFVRTEKGLSRDKACKLFERISPDRLERIENGKVLPNPEEIMELAEKYGEPNIRNYYCANQCPMGRNYVSEVENLDLSQATLQIIAQINKISSYKDRLIEIASKGHVTEGYSEEFDMITSELEELQNAIDSLILWKEKNEE